MEKILKLSLQYLSLQLRRVSDPYHQEKGMLNGKKSLCKGPVSRKSSCCSDQLLKMIKRVMKLEMQAVDCKLELRDAFYCTCEGPYKRSNQFAHLKVSCFAV